MVLSTPSNTEVLTALVVPPRVPATARLIGVVIYTVIDFRFEHPLKALSPILVMELGIVTSVRYLLFSKALSEISVTVKVLL